jgi:GTP-binding protein EngB required for normal cell division
MSVRDSLGGVFHLVDSRHKLTNVDQMVSITHNCYIITSLLTSFRFTDIDDHDGDELYDGKASR